MTTLFTVLGVALLAVGIALANASAAWSHSLLGLAVASAAAGVVATNWPSRG